jgi:hypothetical protein
LCCDGDQEKLLAVDFDVVLDDAAKPSEQLR